MPWTGNNSKYLRSTQNEVEDLGDEEQKKGLAEVTEDADHGERHAGEVAQGVSWEDTRWKPERCGQHPCRLVTEARTNCDKGIRNRLRSGVA